MIIDIHTHVTYTEFPEFSTQLGRSPFTAETLLKRMDQEGIDKSVILPLSNPENLDFFAVVGNQECIAVCQKYPDRLIPFCNIDPRFNLNNPEADFSNLLRVYKDFGCKGIGEVCANLPFDDPRCQNLYQQAGDAKLPVLFHLTRRAGRTYGLIEETHLRKVEKMLEKFPQTKFIGHAPAFWNEIDGRLAVKNSGGYPKGPIRKRGRLWELMEKYGNLFADISASSGFNAISRDPEVGYEFLKKFNRKVFFGTDRFTRADEPDPPILHYLIEAVETKKIGKRDYENIMHRNIEREVLS